MAERNRPDPAALATNHPESKAKLAFFLAVTLLLVSGFSATFFIYRVLESERLVRRTYEMEVSLGQVDTALAKAGRSRVAFVDSGNPAMLADFQQAKQAVNFKIEEIRYFLVGHSELEKFCDQLEMAANQRLGVMQHGIELKQQGKSDPAAQAAITSQIVEYAFQTASASNSMKQIEDQLLQQRAEVSGALVSGALVILIATFALSALLFWYHQRLLGLELLERRVAENNARELSERVMRIQDDERRRFARELHDSLGQFLTAAKMSADSLVREYPQSARAGDVASLINTSLRETRTLSHLLHPPLLDEVGFATAARWMVDGYSQRTGVAVTTDLPDVTSKLSGSVELTLFRILQEALTNIHRHSKSKKAEVSVTYGTREVRLVVEDYGAGIPREILKNFLDSGTGSGVGLSGMRARVREQGGTLDIKSSTDGTEIHVIMPIPPGSENENGAQSPKQTAVQPSAKVD
jgi:signal transduction histidine kinase